MFSEWEQEIIERVQSKGAPWIVPFTEDQLQYLRIMSGTLDAYDPKTKKVNYKKDRMCPFRVQLIDNYISLCVHAGESIEENYPFLIKSINGGVPCPLRENTFLLEQYGKLVSKYEDDYLHIYRGFKETMRPALWQEIQFYIKEEYVEWEEDLNSIKRVHFKNIT